MDKNAIKKYAVSARRALIGSVAQRAALYGITAEDVGDARAQVVMGRVLSSTEQRQRRSLIERIRTEGYTAAIEGIAYTWFNRFIALRFMEVNGYLPSRVRVFTDENDAFRPQIMTEALDLTMEGLDPQQIYAFKNANDDEGLFKYLIIAQCNALNAILPRMFQRIGDDTELLFPENLLRDGSVVHELITRIPAEDWQDQVQIIGWLYQYYNSEPKDTVFANLKKNIKVTKDTLPAATQLFTPDWIVRYMVENSLGRLWLAGHPNGDLRAGWRYYMEEAEQTEEVAEQLRALRAEAAALSPEEIRCIDPCMGSGHILAYLFDVLIEIYGAHGYATVDAVKNIVTKNLYGLDIDERAAQLAYFTVMMKARAYDRGFFRRGIQPNAYAIVESNADGAFIYDGGEGIAEEEHAAALSDVMAAFTDAREYGSLIVPPAHDYAALANAWEWSRMAAAPDVNMTLWSSETNERIPQLIRQAQILTQKYHIVVTNPPYMGSKGMGAKLAKFVKEHYPDSKSDLFAAFIERCGDFARTDGYHALVTQHAWMFLSSYEKLRAKLLQKEIISMAHLGARAFEEIGGEVVQTTAFVLANQHIDGYAGSYARLVDANTQDAKEELYLSGAERYAVREDSFEKIPGMLIAYWASQATIRCFSHRKLADVFTTREGMATADNERFLRFWHEVNFSKITIDCESSAEAKERDVMWVPYNKGGITRDWYGNNDYVVDWSNDGEGIRNNKDPKTGRIRSHNYNGEYSFQEGLTWTAISSGNLSIRYCPAGYLFDSKGAKGFTNNSVNFYFILALLNSKASMKFLEFLSPTLDFKVGDIISIPYIEKKEYENDVLHMTKETIDIARTDWDSYETSWDFARHPLLTRPSATLAAAYERYKAETNARFDQLKANEEELNRIFIDIYGLADELTPAVAERDVTVTRVYDTAADVPVEMRGSSYILTRADAVRSLISYAVGCMFGRYSLDEEGIVYAGGEWDATCYKTFIPDADAIIPVCDDEYFIDDIAARFVSFVETVYGAETLEENLRFIADALGGQGSPRTVIRSYFLRDFYADHVRRYRKRPIYWLFDSGEKNGFKALVYLHRYAPDTLARMRTDYIHPQQSRYQAALADAERLLTEAQGAERVRLTKRRTALRAQEEELHAYEERVHHLADQMIALDLDDGVRHNYALLQDVLAKLK